MDAPQEQDNLFYDLGNLMVYNDMELSMKRSKDTDYLLQLATEHCQSLMNQLCQLPTEPTPEVGRLIVLPDPTTRLPREKPIPEQKALTKWEKFAKTKGIVKRKRDKLVYDEEYDEWRDHYGKNKANDISQRWAIAENEVKTHDPKHKGLDPWAVLALQKKERVGKNKKQNERNLQLATTTRRTGSAQVLDLSSAIGKEAPGKRNAQHKEKKARTHTDIALQIAQKSTNSLGKFDKLRRGEERVVHKKKSNMVALAKYDNEAAQSKNVMKRVLGKENESSAVNLKKVMHAVGATSIKSGEITTHKSVKDARKLKMKMKKATTDKKFSRVNTRIAKGKGQGAARAPKSKKGGSGGKK